MSTCRHPDIRKFDGFRSCLACGTAVFELELPELSARGDQPKSTKDLDQVKPYKYRELNYELGQEIRLLIIQPGGPADPIVCDIIMVNLLDKPAYDALSYTWATEYGDSTLSELIEIVGGTTLRVSKNCKAAIQRLRKRWTRRRFWIDALCIDQDNIQERNHQVSQMENIYRDAVQVVVYLDTANHDFTNLFCCLRKEPMSEPDPRPCEIDISSLHFEVRALLRLRWFHRVWVIQEVALARHICLMIENDHIALSPEVVARLRFLNNWNRAEDTPLPGPLRLAFRDWGHEASRALDCLLATGHCGASDPRDKVFGIVGLLHPRTRSLIPIDYGLDLDTLYTIMIDVITAQEGNIVFLTFPNHRVATLSTPTSNSTATPASVSTAPWIPDRRNYYVSTTRQFTRNSIGPWSSKSHEISHSHSPLRYVSTNYKRPSIHPLRVEAHFIDRIGQKDWIGTMTVQDYASYAQMYWMAVDQSIHSANCDKGCHACYKLPQGSPSEIYNSNLSTHQHRSFPEHLSLLARTALQYFPNRSIRPPVAPMTLEAVPFFPAQSKEAVFGHVEPYNEFLGAAARVVERPRERNVVFRTEHSLGYAANNQIKYTQGDEIWALDGARSPFILRKISKNKYRIMCDCYLMAALEYGEWKRQGGRGPWGELPDCGLEEDCTRIIDIF